MSEEAKVLIGSMAHMIVILLAILKDLWVLWERLVYEMGEKSLVPVWMVLEHKQLSVVPVLLTLGRSKPIGSQLSAWSGCLHSIDILHAGNT